MCAVNYVTPSLRIPLTRHVPLLVITIPYGIRAVYNEFLNPYTDRKPGIAQCDNFGCIGGFFCGLIFWRLLVLTKADQKQAQRFLQNLGGMAAMHGK